MPFDTVKFTVDDRVARVTLARPAFHNAYNVKMRDELFDVFTACAANPDLLAVVIDGEGSSFCSGADLTEFGTAPSPFEARRIRFQRDVWAMLASIRAVTVACMHGHVIGSGLEMSLLCDLRIADPATSLKMPEAYIGLIPAATGTQTIPRAVGENWANRVLYLGDTITATEAKDMGLLDVVTPDALTVIGDALALWRTAEPTSLRRLKEALQIGRTGPWMLRRRAGGAAHRGRSTGARIEAFS